MPRNPHLATSKASPEGMVLSLQQRRLRQILWAIILALGIITLLSLSRGAYISVAVEIMAIGLLFQGLFDEAVMACPALLVFASMYGSRRLFILLMGCMLAVLVALVALHQTGMLRSVADPFNLARAVILATILAVTGFFVWLLSGDLRQAMAQLEAEKQALITSHERIEVLAHRDTLTLLPNRTLAKDRLAQLLLQSQRERSMVAVMFLDLDNFKTVNDSLGHTTGDRLLCLVAERLSTSLRASDTLARLSGDEFLILLGGIRSDEAITAATSHVMQLLEQAFSLEELDVVVTTSLGIAVSPRDGTEVDTLLKNADLAMYQAKGAGRNTFRFFDASMNESVVEHLHMASGLRTALARGELQVHYQPQFDLRSGRIIGAEALLRWQHPSLGFLPPNRFIPVAERTGLINEMGAWVLRRACEDVQSWRAQGLGDLTVAVNVSPIQFHRDSIEREVTNALVACQLPPHALELELTESLLVADAQHLSEMLQRLRAQGVQIAIDDFGTGYSNLGYLQRFAVHRLKIDQSFVRKMGTSAHDEGIVRAIIEMAHCLGLEVVAEGVEDAAMLQMLQSFGCEFGQGFHWSPALPTGEFVAFVRKHHDSPAEFVTQPGDLIA